MSPETTQLLSIDNEKNQTLLCDIEVDVSDGVSSYWHRDLASGENFVAAHCHSDRDDAVGGKEDTAETVQASLVGRRNKSCGHSIGNRWCGDDRYCIS